MSLKHEILKRAAKADPATRKAMLQLVGSYPGKEQDPSKGRTKFFRVTYRVKGGGHGVRGVWAAGREDAQKIIEDTYAPKKVEIMEVKADPTRKASMKDDRGWEADPKEGRTKLYQVTYRMHGDLITERVWAADREDAKMLLEEENRYIKVIKVQ